MTALHSRRCARPSRTDNPEARGSVDDGLSERVETLCVPTASRQRSGDHPSSSVRVNDQRIPLRTFGALTRWSRDRDGLT